MNPILKFIQKLFKKRLPPSTPEKVEDEKPKGRFVSFEEAMRFARQNNIQTSRQWKSIEKMPRRMPRSPHVVYKKEFQEIGGWGGFLGTGKVSLVKQKILRQYVSYEEAKAWGKEQGITTSAEWKQCKMRPENIPLSPHHQYKEEFYEKGGWGGLLETGFVAYRNRTFVSYQEAQKWAIENNVKSSLEWSLIERPANIPSTPGKMYKKEFMKNGGWRGFLGIKRLHGVSMNELFIKAALNECFEIKDSGLTKRNYIQGSSGKKYLVDMAYEKFKIVIEYDGSYWHQEKEEKDRIKNQDLTEAGWRVINLREDDLPPINEKTDLRVASSQLPEEILMELAWHLIALNNARLVSIPAEKIQKVEELLVPQDFSRFSKKALSLRGYKTREEAVKWLKENNVQALSQWKHFKNKPEDLPNDLEKKYGENFLPKNLREVKQLRNLTQINHGA